MASKQYIQGILFEEYADCIEVQSTSELANPWALDCDGNPILPENAERRGTYTCPKCKGQLHVKKRGKGKRSRRDHFYHKADSACKGFTPRETESYIHKTAKECIFKMLESCVDNAAPFPITWTCPICGQRFTGNLLHNAKSIKVEKQFKDKAEGQDHKQPDVSLVDENGKLLVAIEVVYTHDIEPETWNFYNANHVTVIRLVFETVEELNNIEQKIHNPDSVNVCLNITCKECQSMHQPRQLTLHKDDAGHYFFVVNLHNPFDAKAIQGIPFNDEEVNQANRIVKQKSQLYSVELRHNERGFHFALIMQRQVTQRPQYRRTHLTLDEMEALGINGHRKPSVGRYKSKSKSTSKSKPKTSSNYGKRSSKSNRGGGKRRK